MTPMVVPPATATRSVFTLQEIIEGDFPTPAPLAEKLLSPGETGLFIARQKEGKSTLSLQFGIDVSHGDPFLGRFATVAVPVLYVDYENRLHRLKLRGLDLAQGRRVENLRVKAFDRISERDVGLFGQEHARLSTLVKETEAGLLILDPLRYALYKGSNTGEEAAAMAAVEAASKLRDENPNLAILLVHHLKKQQQPGLPRLKDDPRSWIDRVYGSQALLAHVDTIWGLEEEGDGYVFATVPRSQDPLILALEKHPDSERFLLGSADALIFRTQPQRQAWEKLPAEFRWREATDQLGISNNTLDRVIRQARAAGLLTQDPETKRYRKVGGQ